MLTGTVAIDGRQLAIRRPADAIGAGIFLIPEDRRVEGLFLSDTVKHNISIAILPSLSRVSMAIMHFFLPTSA